MQAGKAAFAWRDPDAALAVLSHDLADAVRSGTRAEASASRSLTFVVGDRTIELEVTQDAVVGQVIPAPAGEVELVGPNGRSGSVAVDDVGWFTIRPIPSGPVRLHLRTADGPVHTEWVIR